LNIYFILDHNRLIIVRWCVRSIPPVFLPSGIFPLSKTEIKTDVREMERSMHDDTDSDGSVLSEDVLMSIYPVKPRKVPKVNAIPRPSAMSAGEGEDGEYDSKLVEQSLTFLDAVKRNRKDLYNAECERERFESQGVVSRLLSCRLLALIRVLCLFTVCLFLL
jgi:hypothetical protein